MSRLLIPGFLSLLAGIHRLVLTEETDKIFYNAKSITLTLERLSQNYLELVGKMAHLRLESDWKSPPIFSPLFGS